MAKRLVSTVWVQSPNLGPVSFGPEDKDIPKWATDQMGEHCWVDYDPAGEQPVEADADLVAENRRLNDELIQLRADNDSQRLARGQYDEGTEALQARIAELETVLEDRNVEGFKALEAELAAVKARNAELEQSDSPPDTPAPSDGLDELKKPELEKLAAEAKLDLKADSTKTQIIEALRANASGTGQ